MVEQIRISPEEVRGYGNVLEEHELDDFTVNVSSLSKVSETVHGALTHTYKLLYSVYGLMFDFDKGAKQLYLQTNEANTLSLGFDTQNKQLYLVDENDTGFSLDFDEDTNELYITDDAPPVVHNYSLAFSSSSYVATGGSAEVSVTLLDDNVEVSGATVTFTGGTSTVTGVTNSSGVATATVSVSATSTITATYGSASDTCTVTVSSSQTITLATNKNILSYYDSESATLTATLTGGTIANQTVTFYKGSTSIGTATTNSSGVATKSYSSTGVGDVSFTASANGNTSEAVAVEDCLFYGINTNAFTIPSNTTFESDGTKITATTNTSGEKEVFFNHNFSSSDDFEYEVEVAAIGVSQYCGLLWNTSTYYGGHQNGQNKAYAHMGNDTEIAHTWAVGDKYKVVKQGSTTTAYINTTTIKSSSTSYSSNYKVGFFINRSRTQYYKNIKIKLLN